MSEPTTEFLRYGVARDWLKEFGISEFQFLKLIDSGTIKRGPAPGRTSGRNYYYRSQILRDVLQRHGKAEKPERLKG